LLVVAIGPGHLHRIGGRFDEFADRLDGDLRRKVAAAASADSVANYIQTQRIVEQNPVLVLGTDTPDIGDSVR
jgi:hypothetical protein